MKYLCLKPIEVLNLQIVHFNNFDKCFNKTLEILSEDFGVYKTEPLVMTLRNMLDCIYSRASIINISNFTNEIELEFIDKFIHSSLRFLCDLE